MGETPPGSPPGGPKIDVSASKLVAFIGTVFFLIEGLTYIRYWNGNPPLWGTLTLVAGIIHIAIGILLFFVLNVVNLEISTPYEWWLLVTIGGGMIAFALITYYFIFGCCIFNSIWIRGGCLVALAGAVKGIIEDGKLDWTASKLVLLVGSGLGIFLIIRYQLPTPIFWVFMIVGIGLCVLVILAIFDVIPNEWWLLIMIGGGIYYFYSSVAGVIILAGFLLHILDY